MPIKIEVTEPELLPPSALKHLASFFLALGGVAFASETVTLKAGDLEKTVTRTSLTPTAAPQSIHELADAGAVVLLDNVGLVETPVDPDTRISDDPAAVFGGEAPKPADAVAPTPPAPVAPVAPTAPASTAPAAPTQNSEIATDRDGFPYDRRIHSESKSINKTDGLWRTKRGVDPALVAQVQAEHRALPPIAASVTNVPKPDPAPTHTAAPAPVAPTAPTAPVAPASAQASTTPKNLGELMIVAQQLVASGKIASLDVVRATAAELGVVALPLLGTRPDMVEAVYNKLIGA